MTAAIEVIGEEKARLRPVYFNPKRYRALVARRDWDQRLAEERTSSSLGQHYASIYPAMGRRAAASGSNRVHPVQSATVLSPTNCCRGLFAIRPCRYPPALECRSLRIGVLIASRGRMPLSASATFSAARRSISRRVRSTAEPRCGVNSVRAGSERRRGSI